MDGSVKEFVYDKSGRKTSEKTWLTGIDGEKSELVTRFEHDNEDRVIKTTNPDGSIHRTEYNNIGKISAVVDVSGLRTEYGYDSRGNETEVRYPDATTEQKNYDAAGNLLSETDRAGNTISYEYDEANRKTASVNADGSRTETEYDAAGRVSAEIDAKGNRTAYGYDAAGRRTSVTDALGNVTHYEYDAANRVTAIVDALDRRTTYVYNDRDQRVETIYADGTKIKDEFDAASRRVASFDQANVKTQFGYDKQGRLEKVIDVMNQVTLYAYDDQGNKVSQTDAEGRITQWRYDNAGRNISRKLPLGQQESFVYDGVGLLDTKTNFNGQETDYTYDSNQRLVRVDYVDGSAETFEYDAMGNRTRAQQISSDGVTNTTNWAYDALNRLSSEMQPNGAVLEYSYDLNGNRTQVKLIHDSSTQITDYTYDALNRLSSVIDTTGVATYGYDGVGNRTSVSYPNGTSHVYRYDNVNRLTKLETYGANGALVEQYDYLLNAIGRRTQIKELNGRTSDYTYNVLNRLTQEAITDTANGNYITDYVYDKVGNRVSETVNGVSKTFSYDLNDRLLSAGSTSYTYDNNGNTLSSTGAGVVGSFQYNAKNQLASATNAGVTAVFGYDINGIRNTKSSNAITTHFVVDSNRDYAQVLNEFTEGSHVYYTYGDDLISQTRNAQTHFYHYDGLGSTRLLSNGTGNFTDGYNYQAFGELLNQTGSTENNYLFTGEQFDRELQQYYLRARYFDQSIGRFTQMDEWLGKEQVPITLNKYVYGNSDPVRYIDPSGYFGLADIGAALNIRGIQAASIQASFRVTLKQIGKDLACVAIEETVTELVIQQLTGGVYVLGGDSEGYVGRTNDFDRRMQEHVSNGKRKVEGVLALFHMEMDRNEQRLVEQFFMDVFRAANQPLTNEINSIAQNPSSPNSQNLRRMLNRLDFCD